MNGCEVRANHNNHVNDSSSSSSCEDSSGSELEGDVVDYVNAEVVRKFRWRKTLHLVKEDTDLEAMEVTFCLIDCCSGSVLDMIE